MHNQQESKKDLFLKSIAGTTHKYKRWLGSPLRYAGGKSLATGYIVEQIPSNITKVVSPFIGGASVEIALANKLGIEVIGYDIFSMLTNYWNAQINHPNKLYKILLALNPDPVAYEKTKRILTNHWKNGSDLDALTLAAYYYYNHNLSYGPGFLGWMSSIYKDGSKYKKMIERVRDFTCPNLKVLSGVFHDVIPSHKDDFLYCDPPYYLGGDSKMFTGIYPQRNFPIHHKDFDHKGLCNLLRQHTGGFVLSYNDCSYIRELYKEYDIIEVAWQYTMGQGETRIGINRRHGTKNHVKKSHEILIVKR